MTWDKIDRCGIGLFSLPVSHPFTAACKRHDQRYLHGGTREDMVRWNNDFLEDMLRLVEFHNLSDVYKVEAFVLYAATKTFGEIWLREENRLPMGNADKETVEES